MDEKSRLEREIQFYTALLKNHSKNTQPQPLGSRAIKNTQSQSSRASKNTQSQSSRARIHEQTTSNKQTVTSAGNRQVLTGNRQVLNKKQTRIIVKPQHQSNDGRRTVLPISGTRRLVIPSNTMTQSSASTPSGSAAHHSNKMTQSRRIHTSSNPCQSSSGTSNNRFVWTKNNQQPKDASKKDSKTVTRTSNVQNAGETRTSNVQNAGETRSSVFKINSKYKLVKSTPSTSKRTPSMSCSQVTSNSSQISKNESSSRVNVPENCPKIQQNKVVSRYKISLCQQPHSSKLTTHQTNSSSGFTPVLSKSGKRLISRYKITRKSQNKTYKIAKRQIHQHGASPSLKAGSRSFHSRYKLNCHRGVDVRRGLNTRYKIDKLQHLRKKLPPIYHSQKFAIKSRRLYKWKRDHVKTIKPYISQYKLIRKSMFPAGGRIYHGAKKVDRTALVRKIASRALQRSAALSLRAKYKKNNTNDKHCLFFMRFGKCNRGSKCFYIHDPQRIAVCTRYLRGTCNIENCPFSHEAKKEKVPVCQHYLRGFCLRENCPYLHVNVGKNAPICESFAERRYCHLGDKCKKLHTDICPERDETGKCPKGMKCRLRHPKKIVKTEEVKVENKRENKSENLKQLVEGKSLDERPVKSPEVFVPSGEKLSEVLPAYISLNSAEGEKTIKFRNESVKKLKNKPSFLE